MADDSGEVKLFALSTCVHCKNTKQYLEEHGVDYKCVFVDQLEGDERKAVLEEIRAHNPKLSFPTLVCGNGRVIVGFHKEDIKEALDL
ncbi:glutaredoxin family protein [Nitratidesulfovibrio sp. HK-II]|jgi:glutaredoxin-like protein NrdH|uniref:glutaredoxin family protein n=1 Tax=Nitratidesulfovibrio sp. HK-II TaxID=2009266 RepID=UPI000E2ECD86|nr:glutaredoxin family protein [Nitratidesulfovibrio sp. HK-II]GBO96656.1 glutaredoxin family protein [Nitratidesulfovibrio sp. HK-II]